jgi:hypothetical protein
MKPDPLFQKRLARAFGAAVLAGALAACIGTWLALSYNRSLTASPDFGGIREAMWGMSEAAIFSALLGGMSVFLGALMRFDIFGPVTGKRMGIAFFALIPVLICVGGAVWVAFELILLTQN